MNQSLWYLVVCAQREMSRFLPEALAPHNCLLTSLTAKYWSNHLFITICWTKELVKKCFTILLSSRNYLQFFAIPNGFAHEHVISAFFWLCLSSLPGPQGAGNNLCSLVFLHRLEKTTKIRFLCFLLALIYLVRSKKLSPVCRDQRSWYIMTLKGLFLFYCCYFTSLVLGYWVLSQSAIWSSRSAS